MPTTFHTQIDQQFAKLFSWNSRRSQIHTLFIMLLSSSFVSFPLKTRFNLSILAVLITSALLVDCLQ